MKKILIAGILVSIVLVSIGVVTAGNIFSTGDVTDENDNIYCGEENCICDGQCNGEQRCNQNTNGNCLKNSNSNGCCKIN